MKIGLIDVDGHNFPNLALMKISAWHKQQGHTVEWVDALLGRYDKVYISKVFTFTEDYMYPINAKEVIRGGTGYDLNNKLDNEIEHMYPDYSLYSTDVAYGYLTRGCPRGCAFCIVSEKEGKCSNKVANLNEFWNGQKEIKLLDPNLLACKEHLELLDQLAESKAYIDFTQGLDARLLNDDNIAKIQNIKLKIVHFAWDKQQDEAKILSKLIDFKKVTGINKRKASVYMLTNFDTTFEYDLYRVYKLRELGYSPYVMIYEKDTAPQNIRYLQRWVNNKILFRSCERFEDYNCKIG